MAYQVPLRFIEVGEDLAICATRIVSIMSVSSFQTRNLLRDERQNKTLINGCGRDAAKTAIIMDNGSVISSPYSIKVLMSRIEKAGCKNITDKKAIYTYAYDESTEEEGPEDNATDMGTDIEELAE